MGSHWETWSLNPRLSFPAQSTRAGKRCPHNIWLGKLAGILSTRERQVSARDTDTLWKGQCTKPHLQPLTLDSGRGRGEQTRVSWKETKVCGSGKRAEGTAVGVPEGVLLTHQRHYLSWVEHLIWEASAWGNAAAPPSGLPASPPCGACILLRSQMPCPGCRGLGRLGLSVTELNSFELGAISPHFYESNWCPPHCPPWEIH